MGASPASDGAPDAIVVGAGIAGLSAAYTLARSGHDVTVLERNDRLGGRTYLKQKHGISFSVGTACLDFDGFGPMLRQVYADLGIEPRPIPAPFSAAWSEHGTYLGEEGMLLHLVRAAGLEALNNLVDAAAAAAAAYVPLPDTRLTDQLAQLDAETGRAWLTRMGVSDTLIGHLNVDVRAIFGASVDDISALAIISVAPFIMPVSQRLEETDVESLRQVTGFDPAGVGFHGFARGVYEVVDRIAQALGDRIRLGHEVLAVERQGDGIRVKVRIGGDERVIDAPLLISAVQAPAARRLLGDAIEPERQGLLEAVDYTPLAIVSLFSDTPIFDQAFVLHAPDGGRISYYMDPTWFPRGHGDWAHGDRRVLNALIVPQSAADRRILAESDRDLIDIALGEIDALIPGVHTKVTDTEVTRHPLYSPVLRPGIYRDLQRLHALNRPPVLLAGDYLRAPHFEAAAETGRLVAEAADAAPSGRMAVG